MQRFTLGFAWLGSLATSSMACVEPADAPDVETVESDLTVAWCVDHPCPDLNVRVLKSTILIQTVVLQDACSMNGSAILVGNHGTANAGASTLEMFTPSTGARKRFAIPALAPGYSFQITTTVPKNSTVTADVNDSVAEGNENQNQYKYYCL